MLLFCHQIFVRSCPDYCEFMIRRLFVHVQTFISRSMISDYSILNATQSPTTANCLNDFLTILYEGWQNFVKTEVSSSSFFLPLAASPNEAWKHIVGKVSSTVNLPCTVAHIRACWHIWYNVFSEQSVIYRNVWEATCSNVFFRFRSRDVFCVKAVNLMGQKCSQWTESWYPLIRDILNVGKSWHATYQENIKICTNFQDLCMGVKKQDLGKISKKD